MPFTLCVYEFLCLLIGLLLGLDFFASWSSRAVDT